MAEINMPTGAQKPGVRRSKKHSTRVDLTPMVDLGFLLITFFVFTTQLSKPVVADLYMPKDSPDSTKAPASGALTAVLLPDNKVFYYHGDLGSALQAGTYGTTNFSVGDGIGQVIRDKQKAMDKTKPGSGKDLVLMIKQSEESTYSNTVDIMDEVQINVLKHYAFMDLTAAERTFIASKKMVP
jgi:biopolymer transport protein ExbD